MIKTHLRINVPVDHRQVNTNTEYNTDTHLIRCFHWLERIIPSVSTAMCFLIKTVLDERTATPCLSSTAPRLTDSLTDTAARLPVYSSTAASADNM